MKYWKEIKKKNDQLNHTEVINAASIFTHRIRQTNKSNYLILISEKNSSVTPLLTPISTLRIKHIIFSPVCAICELAVVFLYVLWIFWKGFSLFSCFSGGRGIDVYCIEVWFSRLVWSFNIFIFLVIIKLWTGIIFLNI